ncbi:MAG: ATP-binding cassette domain-containing protein [Pseudomonadota bacterium]
MTSKIRRLMVILRDISLRRGPKLLLEGAEASLQNGEHIALIGANGSGKTSLLALLLGDLLADKGEIEGLYGLRIAHMAQEVAASEEAAGDFVLSGDKELADLLKSLRSLEREGDYSGAAALHPDIEARNGYDAERRVQLLLRGLGFEDEAYLRPVSSFSGGWRIRLNLARALMSPSDLLLLDEPTNHLDLDATLWLQRWLKRYAGTLLMISHDRDFIDATCARILQVEHQGLHSYKGGYSAFELQRAERLANQQANFEKQQRRIGEIEEFVRRFRYKATKARQAQSRLKELERMQKAAPAHVDSPFNFRFPAPSRSSDPLLSLNCADLGYGEDPVLRQVDLRLHPGSRIALLGRNGAGKSTLLKSLVGELPLRGGERILGEHCRIGYFDQQQLEALDLAASPLLHLQRLQPEAREQDILDYLGGFNFRGDNALQAVAPLSGGEKARLALALVAWQKPNLLILDEPTNHLDLDMCHALEIALQDYDGAVVLVSHDRHLLRNTVDELLLVHNQGVEPYADDLDGYASWLLANLATANPGDQVQGLSHEESEQKRATTAPNRREQRQQAAAQRQRLRPLQKKIESLEREMQGCEEALEDIRAELSDSSLYEAAPNDQLAALLRREGQSKQKLSQLEEAWLAAQDELDSLHSSGAG